MTSVYASAKYWNRAQLVEAGKLGVLVNKILPLKDVAQAHRLIEEGGITGKVVLVMD